MRRAGGYSIPARPTVDPRLSETDSRPAKRAIKAYAMRLAFLPFDSLFSRDDNITTAPTTPPNRHT